MRFLRLVGRAVRMRCPRCGQGAVFRGWFRTHEACSHCGATFQREPGFFLGAIYFNYGLTALVSTVAYLVGVFVFHYPPQLTMFAILAFCCLFPLWFFRHARSLWLGFDEYFDPRG